MRVLAYIGTLPLVIAAILAILKIDFVPFIGNINYLPLFYGLIIAAFMCGNYWGYQLSHSSNHAIALVIYCTVAVAILCLFALAISPFVAQVVLILTFISMIIVDAYLKKHELLTLHDFKRRMHFTLIIIIALSITTFLH